MGIPDFFHKSKPPFRLLASEKPALFKISTIIKDNPTLGQILIISFLYITEDNITLTINSR